MHKSVYEPHAETLSLFEKGSLALVGVKGFRLNPTLARYVRSKLGSLEP